VNPNAGELQAIMAQRAQHEHLTSVSRIFRDVTTAIVEFLKYLRCDSTTSSLRRVVRVSVAWDGQYVGVALMVSNGQRPTPTVERVGCGHEF